MVNEDVIDLYDRVGVGTKVVVLPIAEHRVSSAWVRSRSNEDRVLDFTHGLVMDVGR
jgi:hypothetical protein